jgi:hypothetical protein
MNAFRMFVICVFSSAAADAADQPSPAASVEVGMIVDYSPARSTHTIRRGAVTLPVKLGTLLVAGDVIVVGGGGRVVVQLNDDTQHDVGPGEWRVPAAKPLGPIASLLRSLPRLLDVQAHIAASASTRGGETCDGADQSAAIEAPILRDRSKVTAGKQSLALGWFGGCAPFGVALKKGDTQIGTVQGLKRRQQQFADLDLTVGLYELRITDAQGHERAYAIDAVAATPPPPADLEATDSATATIARALWLADLDEGAWRLESYKTLRPLMAQKERIAVLIGQYLLISTDAAAAATP